MSQYTLLGRTVEFSTAEDNFYQLQALLWQALSQAQEHYSCWYEVQMSADNVINNCKNLAKEIMSEFVLEPLYPKLAKDFQLYGVSKNDCLNACANLVDIDEIQENAIETYENIQEALQEDIEEIQYNNELRKAGQISFGIGDSLKNAASNALHGISNSADVSASREMADNRKKKLYNDLREPLWDALSNSIVCFFASFQDFINERVPDSIVSNYDRESSNAYLDNAKAIPEKRQDLIVEAFKKCPWNTELYVFVFKEFSQERRNIIAISQSYNVSLQSEIDTLLRTEYTKDAKSDEALAVKAKMSIKKTMEEWGVSESAVIDEIEKDCLDRLIADLATADEARCNELKAELEKYDALDKNKKTYFESITKRIEYIWAKEDGEIFDNYLSQANILSPKAVEEGKQYVKEKGRTQDANKYLSAFEHCTLKNIKKARLFQKIKTSKLSFLQYLGFVLVGIGLGLFFVQEDFIFFTQLFPIMVGGACQVYIGMAKKEWSAITVEGKAINPILTLSSKDFEKKNQETLTAESHQKNA